MDTFHLTRLKCIYIAQMEAWMVDDWTRVRAVHLNDDGRDGRLMSLSTKKYLSYQDNRTRRLIRVFTVCKNGLAIFL